MSPRTKATPDKELSAISAILSALQGLEGDSIQRVLDYVFERLSLSRGPLKPTATAFGGSVFPPSVSGGEPAAENRRISIRDLKDEKQPDSSNQMAALVAFYLSELAPPDERKDAVSAADLEKYYKQARFHLPNALHKTLPNAARAGYFDQIGPGRFRLNPVGYNLVVHNLPRSEGSSKGTSQKRKKKTAAKR